MTEQFVDDHLRIGIASLRQLIENGEKRTPPEILAWGVLSAIRIQKPGHRRPNVPPHFHPGAQKCAVAVFHAEFMKKCAPCVCERAGTDREKNRDLRIRLSPSAIPKEHLPFPPAPLNQAAENDSIARRRMAPGSGSSRKRSKGSKVSQPGRNVTSRNPSGPRCARLSQPGLHSRIRVTSRPHPTGKCAGEFAACRKAHPEKISGEAAALPMKSLLGDCGGQAGAEPNRTDAPPLPYHRPLPDNGP